MADESPCLTASELGHIGILLLRQHRATGRPGVIELIEAKLLRGVQHNLLAEPRRVYAAQRENEQHLSGKIAIRHGIERIRKARGKAQFRRGAIRIQRQRGAT